MSYILKYILCFIFLTMIFSCKKEENNVLNVSDIQVKEFLSNIPINGDTIYIDSSYGIDFRVDLNGYKIEGVKINIANFKDFVFDTAIINTDCFHFGQGVYPISFVLKTTKLNENDTILIKSRVSQLKVMDNISKMFVHESFADGKLKITWPELDKKHTQYYLIERCMGETPQYVQQIQTYDSIFTDNIYVGEKVNYKISVINKDGGKQKIWNFLKENETPILKVTQHPERGYVLDFSRCKYYSNFGQYIITTGEESNPSILFSSESVTDTSYYSPNAKFADEKQLWLRCLPKEYPEGISDSDWKLYSNLLFARFYRKCFPFDRIAVLDANNFLYTDYGHIYKYNIEIGRKTDSIINPSADYGFIRTTPSGKYFYVADENIYGSPIYIWPSDEKISNQPKYTFQTNFCVPPVSDNLISVMNIKSSTTDSKLAIFNVTSGQNLYTTPYAEEGLISSNGQFIFIRGLTLKLCSFINNNFKIDWELPYSGFSGFYGFDPFSPEICYIWDSNKNFMIKRISDSSNLTSYRLDIESIINIDFFSRRILGYVSDKLIIYNLDSGIEVKEIPAKLTSILFSGYNSKLIGNTIYSNHEMKYDIKF